MRTAITLAGVAIVTSTSYNYNWFPSSLPSTFPSTNSYNYVWPSSSGSTASATATVDYSNYMLPSSSSAEPVSTGYRTVGSKTYPIDYSPKTKGGKRAVVCSQATVRKYNIELPSASVQTLNEDISAEVYVPCSFTTDYGSETSLTYKGAGCRYKGAVGSLLQCLDQKTGRPNGQCRKLSLKVDANYFRDDNQKIDNMQRINLHGMAIDKSFLAERLSYNLLRAAGLAAPCATHAEVYLNGKFDSVYAVVQDPANGGLGKDFFKDDANKGEGAFYKDYWFRPDQANWEWLAKHHNGREEHAHMLQVTSAINAAQETDCATLEYYFDVETLAKITALNDLIGQTDDWRLRHNFQWYVKEDAVDGSKKLVMIPWDYDRLDDSAGGPVRRGIQAGWTKKNFNANTQECLNPTPDASITNLAYAQGVERLILQRKKDSLPPDAGSPISCDKITRMLANCMKDKVDAYFLEYKLLFSSSVLNANIDRFAEKIRYSVSKDSSINYQKWQTGIQSLKTHLRSAPNKAPTQQSTISSSNLFGFGAQTQWGAPQTQWGAQQTQWGAPQVQWPQWGR